MGSNIPPAQQSAIISAGGPGAVQNIIRSAGGETNMENALKALKSVSGGGGGSTSMESTLRALTNSGSISSKVSNAIKKLGGPVKARRALLGFRKLNSGSRTVSNFGGRTVSNFGGSRRTVSNVKTKKRVMRKSVCLTIQQFKDITRRLKKDNLRTLYTKQVVKKRCGC
ncbi:hypothetical protein EBT25_07745 [bacterium]|nr:hypothetical protein [bacterium]